MSFLKQTELVKRTAQLMERLRSIALCDHRNQVEFAREYTEAQYDVIVALLDENHNLAILVAELYDRENVPATGSVLPSGMDKAKLN